MVGFVKSVLYIDIEGSRKPFAKIIDEKSQVIFSPVAVSTDHMTIHKKKDGSGYVFTYSDNDKSERSWDDERVELARKEGYKNPEKHRHYIANRNMAYSDGFTIPLITLHVNKSHYRQSIPEKYAKLSALVIPASSEELELSIYFCSRMGEYVPPSLHTIDTSIGKFAFGVLCK